VGGLMYLPEMKSNDPFYRDGRIYDVMHEKLVADTNFFVEEAVRIGGPVLEVACGTGRIAIPIAKKGIEIVGLDISEGMLSEAKKKSDQENLKIEWVHADCRDFNLNKKFKLIFIPFNSMQHLHDLRSIESFFSNVKKHLAIGGVFIIDVFNPSVSILARGKQDRQKVMDLTDPQTGLKATIEETINYEIATQINRVKWYYSLESEKDYKIDELNMRCFFPQELEALVKYNGFEIVSKFGNFDRDAFASESPKQILALKVKG
jgi:2-polyprenyl-3-methyl-5-hydroxy-6-metoxy-1,4-benzoquinol methylase